MCLRINGDRLPEAIDAFQVQLGRILNETNNLNDDKKNKKRVSSVRTTTKKKIEKDKEESTERSSKYKDVDIGSKDNEITKLKYFKDIGLIGTSFTGSVKIFDAFSFHCLWTNSNKNRKEQQHTNIVTFDVASSLGLMATGGAEGRLVMIDPYALGIINGVVAHKYKEIVNVFFYDEQQQIITIGEDRTICLWDAYRLDRIQVIKDTSTNHVPKFTSSSFDKRKGILYIGCQQITLYKAVVDSKVEIAALQVKTLSKAMLAEKA